jgi:hypothetical protein
MLKTEDTSLPRLDNKLKNNTKLTSFPPGSSPNPLVEVTPSWMTIEIQYYGPAARSLQML